MHLLGMALAFWFSTIVEEAMHGYMEKVREGNKTQEIVLRKTIMHQIQCSQNSLEDVESLDQTPYLYPFSIEYNIILASIWYIVWTNVGEFL